MELTFIYFDIPFWRAEVGKIALFVGGVEFENKTITGEEFQRVKENGYLEDRHVAVATPLIGEAFDVNNYPETQWWELLRVQIEHAFNNFSS